MKIGIYNEPCGGAIGGSEVSVAVLAEALAEDHHEVDILHRYSTLTKETLADYAGVNLDAVRLRRLPRDGSPTRGAGSLWTRYQADVKDGAELSSPYDLFIAFVHRAPPFCAAPAGAVMVLFPLHDPALASRELKGTWLARNPLWKGLHGAWMKRKLQARLGSYQVKIANSGFTQRWTRRRWHTESQVIFPPVDIDAEVAIKANRILSVGRFVAAGTGKKQLEMLKAFSDLKSEGFGDWSYDCVGAAGPSAEDRGYFEMACGLAAKSGAQVVSNVDRLQLRRHYQKAKLFWHATGMGVDDNMQPEKMEHFGIVTVEAMAAGCVPVVINKGGQAEIVEHGISGFLWDSPEDWMHYSSLLMRDSSLYERMSRAARERSRLFSRKMYVDRFRAVLSPYITTPSQRPFVTAATV